MGREWQVCFSFRNIDISSIISGIWSCRSLSWGLQFLPNGSLSIIRYYYTNYIDAARIYVRVVLSAFTFRWWGVLSHPTYGLVFSIKQRYVGRIYLSGELFIIWYFILTILTILFSYAFILFIFRILLYYYLVLYLRWQVTVLR